MDDEEDNKPPKVSQAWMLSFADLVSLMLTFFVLLFSMSSIKVDKWESLVEAVTRRMAPPEAEAVPAPTARYNIGTVFQRDAANLDYLYTLFERTINVDEALEDTRLFRQGDQLVISLPGDLLFPAGEARLTAPAEQAIFNLGGVLRNINNRIGVIGHTDPRPILGLGGTYSSNWELSMARAAAVANALSRAGYAEDIKVMGAGPGRFDRIEADTQERRFALARRVDVIVTSSLGGS